VLSPPGPGPPGFEEPPEELAGWAKTLKAVRVVEAVGAFAMMWTASPTVMVEAPSL